GMQKALTSRAACGSASSMHTPGRRPGLADRPGWTLSERARMRLLARVEDTVGALAVCRTGMRRRLESGGELLAAEAAENELLPRQVGRRLARHVGRERERDRQAPDERPRRGRAVVARRVGGPETRRVGRRAGLARVGTRLTRL